MDRHGITPIIKASCIFSTLHEALAAVGVDSDPRVNGTI
jgi:hypothetical protein